MRFITLANITAFLDFARHPAVRQATYTTFVPVPLRQPSGNVFFVASGLLRHLTSASKGAHFVRWTRGKPLALVAGVMCLMSKV